MVSPELCTALALMAGLKSTFRTFEYWLGYLPVLLSPNIAHDSMVLNRKAKNYSKYASTQCVK
jgi:hypothetical protein